MCIFTIIQYEPDFFPIWYSHYQKHFDPKEIYVLHHVLPDPKTEVQAQRKADWTSFIQSHQAAHGYHLVDITHDQSFDHEWMRQIVCQFQRNLLQSYPWVLFTEVDEIIAPHPRTNLDIKNYANNHFKENNICVCDGYEIVQKLGEESPVDFNLPLLPQRRWWYWSKLYSKPLLSKVPLEWCWGFHAATEIPVPYHRRDENFLLLHLHKLDWDLCLKRNQANAERRWKDGVFGFQNRLISENRLRQWWTIDIDQNSSLANLTEIPAEIKTLL